MSDAKARWLSAKERYEALVSEASELKGKSEMIAGTIAKLEEDILKLTKLTDINKLEDFMARLEKEINLKETTLSEKVAELESQLSEAKKVNTEEL